VCRYPSGRGLRLRVSGWGLWGWFVGVVADLAFVLAEWALSLASQLPQGVAVGCRGVFGLGV
jgi:hypothetical protein